MKTSDAENFLVMKTSKRCKCLNIFSFKARSEHIDNDQLSTGAVWIKRHIARVSDGERENMHNNIFERHPR